MCNTHFPTARATALAVGKALRAADVESADRIITELFGRILNATVTVPDEVFDEPGSTGDQRYDTLFATGLAYVLTTRGGTPWDWMTATPALVEESPRGRPAHRVAADWWNYPEATIRLDALWRAWEHLRLDPTTGISVWYRDPLWAAERDNERGTGSLGRSLSRCSSGQLVVHPSATSSMFTSDVIRQLRV